jgi:macrolide transport system ATP-binding/permease protein
MLLQVHHLTKSFGASLVLSACSFVVNRGERIGVVGANGAGKSTLLRLLTGEEAPDAGTIIVLPEVEIGYLPQSPPELAGRTIDDLVREATASLARAEKRMRELEAEMAATGPHVTTGPQQASIPQLLEEYGQLSSHFEARGGYDLDHRIDQVLGGLRLDYLGRDREIAGLSGGEKTRVGLATLLLSLPDLLLLDEPTNHLDAATLEWLEDYLARYQGAVLMVSHDRQFLNSTVNRILEVDDITHQLGRYEGNYDAYAGAKRRQRAKWEAEYQLQQEEMKDLRRQIAVSARQVGHNRPASDNDKTAYNFSGERVTEAISRNVHSAQARLARLEAAAVPKPPPLMHFQPRFASERVRSRTILGLTGVSKRFGDRLILDGINCAVGPDARILLVGSNGAGKTTLLRLLLGLEAPDEGEQQRAPSIQVGYLPQDPMVTASEQATILDVYRDGLVGYQGTLVAGLLGNGLFRQDDLAKSVGQLSLGQRRKLEIARLLALHPNVLALDEPTNYLSLDVLEVFEQAVLRFPGPVIAISHDRWFASRFAGEVWHLEGGQLVTQAGELSERY